MGVYKMLVLNCQKMLEINCHFLLESTCRLQEEVLEKEFSEWCHDCKEYDKEKHHCPRWCKVIRTTVEEIKGNLDVPDINVGDIELLDSLHEKILKSKFAEEVTEAEIDALVKAKQGLNENKQSLNDGWIPCSERLPQERDWFLAVFKEPDTMFTLVPRVAEYQKTISEYTTNEGWLIIDLEDGMNEYYKVLECVAWQPLPEPYKEVAQ